MILSRASALTFSLMLATSLAADALVAQARPGGGPQELSGWAPPSLGIRAGYDSKQQRNGTTPAHRRAVFPGEQAVFANHFDAPFGT